MGAWGYAPDENDNVRDWIDDIKSGRKAVIGKFLRLTCKQKPTSDDAFIIGGVIYGLVKDGFDLPSKMKAQGISRLKMILQDHDFISGWGEPDKFIKETKKAMQFLKKGSPKQRMFY
jgi:hypothetical protein